MANLFSKAIWNLWQVHFYCAKKLKLGNSTEEFALASVFISTIFFSIAFASVLLLLRIEAKYSIDTKIVSMFFFLAISALQILVLFNQKKNFSKMEIPKIPFKKILISVVIWFFLLLLLGFSMAYDFFDGNLFTLFYYLKIHYLK
ncbi:MAG: hypothetical protein ACPLX7_02825 [Candidatus Kapaibacteriota bacterium]|jgi:phosphatidylglycerophosphate synthase